MEIAEKNPQILEMKKELLPPQIQKKLEKAACKNPVYENLLNEYTSLRKDELQKIANAKAKIEIAEKQLEEDKRLLEEAAAKADMDKYEKVKTDIVKNEETVKLFKGFLSNIERNAVIDPETAKRFYAKANEEIAVIKEQYNKEFVEALNPLIELSNTTFLKLQLLELAKEKMKANLEHTQSLSVCVPIRELNLMNALNRILQNEDYKNSNPSLTRSQKANINQWTLPAEIVLKKEAEKWI